MVKIMDIRNSKARDVFFTFYVLRVLRDVVFYGTLFLSELAATLIFSQMLLVLLGTSVLNVHSILQ